MEKYRFLEENEIIQDGDQIIGTNKTDWFDVYGNIGKVVGSGRVGQFRRRLPFEGKVAFLVTVSATTRVVIDTTGLSDEEIDERVAVAACAKISASPNEYITPENVDWKDTKEDLECPYVEESQYRMLEIGEEVLEGDEYQKRSGEWKVVSSSEKLAVPNYRRTAIDNIRRKITAKPQYRCLELGEEILSTDEARKSYDMPIPDDEEWEVVGMTETWDNERKNNGYVSDLGAKNKWFRRKISASTEPQYRPFKEGDVIEEGDQINTTGKKWVDFTAFNIGHEIHPENVRYSRKLIK